MTSPLVFLRETTDELKKVTWPTQQEVIRLTVVVILVSLIVGLFIGGVDYLLTNALQIAIR